MVMMRAWWVVVGMVGIMVSERWLWLLTRRMMRAEPATHHVGDHQERRDDDGLPALSHFRVQQQQIERKQEDLPTAHVTECRQERPAVGLGFLLDDQRDDSNNGHEHRRLSQILAPEYRACEQQSPGHVVYFEAPEPCGGRGRGHRWYM